MAHIVILGAGLGGMPMAYEMKALLRPGDTVTVLGQGPNYHFVPSNPWVAVRWRKRSDIEFPVAPCLAKKGIAYNPTGAMRVHPDRNADAITTHITWLAANHQLFLIVGSSSSTNLNTSTLTLSTLRAQPKCPVNVRRTGPCAMGFLAGSVGVWDGRTRTGTDEHGRNGEGVWCFAGHSSLLIGCTT